MKKGVASSAGAAPSVSAREAKRMQDMPIYKKVEAQVKADMEPNVSAIAHLEKILTLGRLVLGKEHMLDTREYLKLLSGLKRKQGAEKIQLATRHMNNFRSMFKAYHDEIIEGTLSWLSSNVVILTYGKNKEAKIPLSRIYVLLNEKEDLNETDLSRAAELDYHLYSIFSLLTEDEEESKSLKERARELDASSPLAGSVQEMSKSIRDKVLASGQSDATADPGTVSGIVFKELANNGSLQATMNSISTGFADGTVDLNEVVRSVIQGVQTVDDYDDRPQDEEEVERDDEETEDAPSPPPSVPATKKGKNAAKKVSKGKRAANTKSVATALKKEAPSPVKKEAPPASTE